MSYITKNRLSLEQRHYITDATVRTMWFNFYEGKLRDFIANYGHDFCLVINGSTQHDDAFILPYKDFRDFFTSDFLVANHRWVGYVRADDEVIKLSTDGRAKEKFGHEYHNAFGLLQDGPLPLPKETDASEFAQICIADKQIFSLRCFVHCWTKLLAMLTNFIFISSSGNFL
jgi:hypothetical protein